MDLFEAIQNRRSVRRFEDRPVPDDMIKKIVEAGQWAPSACNRTGNLLLLTVRR
jgi:nitroreductase